MRLQLILSLNFMSSRGVKFHSSQCLFVNEGFSVQQISEESKHNSTSLLSSIENEFTSQRQDIQMTSGKISASSCVTMIGSATVGSQSALSTLLSANNDNAMELQKFGSIDAMAH